MAWRFNDKDGGEREIATLGELRSCVESGAVVDDTSVYVVQEDRWCKAAELRPYQEAKARMAAAGPQAPEPVPEVEQESATVPPGPEEPPARPVFQVTPVRRTARPFSLGRLLALLILAAAMAILTWGFYKGGDPDVFVGDLIKVGLIAIVVGLALCILGAIFSRIRATWILLSFSLALLGGSVFQAMELDERSRTRRTTSIPSTASTMSYQDFMRRLDPAKHPRFVTLTDGDRERMRTDRVLREADRASRLDAYARQWGLALEEEAGKFDQEMSKLGMDRFMDPEYLNTPDRIQAARAQLQKGYHAADRFEVWIRKHFQEFEKTLAKLKFPSDDRKAIMARIEGAGGAGSLIEIVHIQKSKLLEVSTLLGILSWQQGRYYVGEEKLVVEDPWSKAQADACMQRIQVLSYREREWIAKNTVPEDK
jgi:hypothetical protein